MGNSISIQRDSMVFIIICAFIGCSMAVTGCDTPAATNTGKEQVLEKQSSRIITTETGVKIKLTDLGLGDDSQARVINDSSQIAGNYTPPGTLHKGFLWEDGIVTDLGSLGGGRTLVSDMNDMGQIIGTSYLTEEFNESQAYLWENGSMTNICNIIGNNSTATSINNKGQIVGTRNNGVAYMLQEDGTLVNFTSTDEKTGIPWEINDKGQIVGAVAGDAFLWENGTLTKFEDPFGRFTQAVSINESGQIAIVSRNNNLGPTHSYLWEKGTLEDLGILVGDYGRVLAQSINDKGQIVGYFVSVSPHSGFRPFLWEDGVMTDLGSLAPEQSAEAYSINNKGQIVGLSETSDGRNRAVLWEIME